jgi:hypothetical protein
MVLAGCIPVTSLCCISRPVFNKIDAPISLSAYSNVKGDKAILAVDAGVTVFTGVTYDSSITGLTFRGGAGAIAIETNNLDTARIDIIDCNFFSQTGAAITESATSNSTLLVIDRCKFYLNGRVLDMGNGDKTTIRDSWVTCGHATSAFRTAGGVLNIVGMLGVPSVTTGAWIETTGGNVVVERSRFGGEGGGRAIVNSSTGPDLTYPTIPSFLTVQNCEVYSTTHAMRFYDVPNVVIFRDNYGLEDNDGIVWDSTIPAATQLAMINAYIDIQPTVGQITATGDNTASGAPVPQAMAMLAVARRRPQAARTSDYLLTADLWLTLHANQSAYGMASTAASVTGGSPTLNVFGHNIQAYVATAVGSNHLLHWTTAMNSAPAGWYTFVAWVEVTAKSVSAVVVGSNAFERFDLGIGRHLVALPFYYDSALSSSAKVGVTIQDVPVGAAWGISTCRIWAGSLARQATPHAVVYGNAAPASGIWATGDQVINAAAVGGSVMGWVNIGYPNTWKAMPSLAP